ncbi:hypothetical protein EVAR_37314_1 [Eumeta japonica]|uniref:Uncharacterized protein n=1 Tax=Eumeta variegata TaxID=151549 RepID=A0A4C1X1J7_EUMVA|nr:hypothetical protein EVAR_37314_1 [Eumeta japonica]
MTLVEPAAGVRDRTLRFRALERKKCSPYANVPPEGGVFDVGAAGDPPWKRTFLSHRYFHMITSNSILEKRTNNKIYRREIDVECIADCAGAGPNCGGQEKGQWAEARYTEARQPFPRPASQQCTLLRIPNHSPCTATPMCLRLD